MKMLKIIGVAAAALFTSTMASAVQVNFLSDDDGAYTAQNSSTRTIDCIAPDTCDVTPGRYRLIGFNDFHSVYITVNSNGTVRYTYDGGIDFPFAGPGTVTEPPVTEPPVTEPPVTEPPVTEPPVSNAQYRIETAVVNITCFTSEPGRPAEVTGGRTGCAAMCADGYSATGGNCRGTTDNVRTFNADNTGAFFTDIRQPLIETPIQGGYQCDYDVGYQYTGSQYDFNNQQGTEITATAICSTIVTQ